MSNHLVAFDTRSSQQASLFSIRAGLLALVVALNCTPLLADEVGDVAKRNTVSAPQDEVSWMSGGIGAPAPRQRI